MRILIIEDDPGLQALLRRNLAKHGHEVWGAVTIADGAILLATENWDLLLLDYRLPDGTADDLLADHANRGRSLPPFVVMTGDGDERLAVSVMKSGARDYLLKDSTLLEMLPHVTRRIEITIEQELELAKARDALRQQQKLKSIGTLASGIAHEINNPIAIIQNASDLILDDAPAGGEIEENAVLIQEAAERTAVIVKTLLAFARPDHGERRRLAPAAEIIDRTLPLIRKVLEKDRIVVTVDPPAGELRAACRPQQIQQVLMNLLTNARDALTSGETVDGDRRRLGVSTRLHQRIGASWVRLTVENNGPPIEERILEHIFDPFFTTKTRDAGTGLGLSVSHGIMEDHGGHLLVETDERGWTRFHADLPTQLHVPTSKGMEDA